MDGIFGNKIYQHESLKFREYEEKQEIPVFTGFNNNRRI